MSNKFNLNNFTADDILTHALRDLKPTNTPVQHEPPPVVNSTLIEDSAPTIIKDTHTNKLVSIEEQLAWMTEKYAFDPIGWAHDVVDFKCDPWQREALNNLLEYRFITLATGTGVGKTALLAIIIWWFISTRPYCRIPCTAPSQGHLLDILWPELAKWRLRSSFLEAAFVHRAKRIYLNVKDGEKNWFASARTSRLSASKEGSVEGMQGYHADNILLVVDEGSGIANQVFSAIDGAVTTAGAYAVIAGNPIRRSGYFFNIIADERMRVEGGGSWKLQHVSCYDAPHCDRVHIERAIQIYGKNSDYYRTKVLGLPPLADAESLITPESVYDAHLRQLPKTDHDTIILSVDPARFGKDFTTYWLRRVNEHGSTFFHREVGQGEDNVSVAQRALALVKDYNVSHLCIDGIGLGSGVVDICKDTIAQSLDPVYRNCVVHDVVVGADAFDKTRFRNLRAHLYWRVKLEIDTRIAISVESEFLDEELQTVAYGWDSNDKRINIESKDLHKKKLHPQRSPNDADAIAISFYVDLLAESTRDASGDFHYFDAMMAPLSMSPAQELQSNEVAPSVITYDNVFNQEIDDLTALSQPVHRNPFYGSGAFGFRSFTNEAGRLNGIRSKFD